MRAIIAGATGLTGSALLQLLLSDDRFTEVRVLTRRTTGHAHPKLKEFIVDFEKPESWRDLVIGDVLFSALGTTLKQAGSQEGQYRIDHDYQLWIAEAAFANGVSRFVLVSSSGANPASPFFYMRMKGELEMAVRRLPFRHICILQPGPITGPRKDRRSGEEISVKVIRLMNRIGLMRRYRPITGEQLATAMMNAALKTQAGIALWKLDEVHVLAGTLKHRLGQPMFPQV